MMRILWLSNTPGLLHEGEGTGNYGGSGWIGALQRLFHAFDTEDELALSFISDKDREKVVKDGVAYYPIYVKPENTFQKLYRYYAGYKSYNREQYVRQIQYVIDDFHPDVIHLFGLEGQLATILGRTKIPVIVHIQGLLGPVNNAFYPSAYSRCSLVWPPTKREWLLRNGYLYDKKILSVKAAIECGLFKDAHYFMGRTDWDLHLSKLMSSNSEYFKVNEALRPPFYENSGKWRRKNGKLIITSTISETLYKGLDTILKTAMLLKHETDIPFDWNVVGVRPNSKFVRVFERNTKIKSSDVYVNYMGVMDAQNLVDNCLRSSVYVHLSYIDNSPNSVCEAQLLGLPVIAANVGGVSSLIEHGKTGILVPANAPYETAYWLKELYGHADMATAIGLHGVEAANIRHDKNIIIENLLCAYNQVIRRNNND